MKLVDPRAEYQVVLETGIVALLALTSATLNITSCFIVWKNSLLRTWHNLFTVNLIIVDLICTVFTMIFTILVLAYGEWMSGYTMCQFSGYVNTVLSCVGINTLALFSFSRYQLFVHPRHYLRTWNKKVCVIAIGIVWIVALLISAPPLFGWGKITFLHKNAVCFLDFSANQAFSSIYVYVFLAAPLMFAVVYLVRLYLALRSQRRVDDTTNNETIKQLRQTTRAAKSMLFLAFGFLLCWVPAFVVFVLEALDVFLPRGVCLFATFMIYIFAVILPLIYVTTSSEFKLTLRRHFRLIPRPNNTIKPAEQEWNDVNQSRVSTVALGGSAQEAASNGNENAEQFIFGKPEKNGEHNADIKILA